MHISFVNSLSLCIDFCARYTLKILIVQSNWSQICHAIILNETDVCWLKIDNDFDTFYINIANDQAFAVVQKTLNFILFASDMMFIVDNDWQNLSSKAWKINTVTKRSWNV